MARIPTIKTGTGTLKPRASRVPHTGNTNRDRSTQMRPPRLGSLPGASTRNYAKAEQAAENTAPFSGSGFGSTGLPPGGM